MKLINNSGLCIWLTGLPAAGKTTTAEALSKFFNQSGVKHELLDGDQIRTHISDGLGFSTEDRYKNIERISWVASKIVRYGGVVIVSCISPFQKMRRHARELIKNEGNFIEVFVNTPLSTCIERDPKGLYKKALSGEIKNFTGISDPYEEPQKAEIVLSTDNIGVTENISKIKDFLISNNYIYRKIPRALYIGRWQPFHKGHEYIINEKLKAGIPVAIGVRDTPVSETDPYSTEERINMIRKLYRSKDVIVFSVSDIESINIGRRVGYAVNKFDIPSNIEKISATSIREQIDSGEDTWMECVPADTIDALLQLSSSR